MNDFISNKKLFNILEYNFIIERPLFNLNDYSNPNKYFSIKEGINKKQLKYGTKILSHIESFLLVYVFYMKIQLSPKQIKQIFICNKEFNFYGDYINKNDYLYREDLCCIIWNMWNNYILPIDIKFYDETLNIKTLCLIFNHLYKRCLRYFNHNIDYIGDCIDLDL